MKKVLSLVLAAVLVFGMASIGFAATATAGKTISLGDSGYETDGKGFVFTGNKGQLFFYENVDYTTVVNIDKIQADTTLNLAYINKATSTGGTNVALSNTTISDLNRDKITVKRRISKGSDLIDNVKFKNVTNPYDANLKSVAVQIVFIDPFVSTKEKEFDITVYLAIDGSRTDMEWSVSGYMENPTIEVDEDDSVDLSDGEVADCVGYTKSIQIDTGNGLFINTKMFDGQKYYAKSVQEITASDDEITAKYPEIDNIYRLYTVNLKSAANTVEFDIDDSFYVYDADGKYIGMSTDKLPVSDKYYLATKKIDMGADVTEEPADEVPVDPVNPETGGDDVPANINDNPGTGANGLVNVAVVAGLVALAAGAVSMKK